jgi:hypothetical protein
MAVPNLGLLLLTVTHDAKRLRRNSIFWASATPTAIPAQDPVKLQFTLHAMGIAETANRVSSSCPFVKVAGKPGPHKAQTLCPADQIMRSRIFQWDF